MSHFAKINNDGIVQNVIVAEQDFIDSDAVAIHLTGYKLVIIPEEEFTTLPILMNPIVVLLCVKIMQELVTLMIQQEMLFMHHNHIQVGC